MGKITKKLTSFSLEHLQDRNLILRMLKYEDDTYKGKYGQDVFKQNEEILISQLIIQRHVLKYFNFNSDNISLENYRKICEYYYHGPTDYDEEIMNSVLYLRENRCLYYTTPSLHVNDTYPNCDIYNLDGTTKTDLYKEMQGYDKVLVAAFSMS